MRRAYGFETFMKNGKLVGFNLGADFTSEHEWGIDGIKKAFGIDNSKIGIDGRSISLIPNTLIYQDIKINKVTYWFLGLLRYPLKYFFNHEDDKLKESDIQNFELSPYGEDFTVATSWDDSSFGILVNDKNKFIVESLYNSFSNKDVVVGISPSHAFQNGGLKFLIKSLLEQDVIDSVMIADLDRITLKNTAEKTGIYKILEKADKKYFALSPRWKDDDKQDVIFWLNPYNQQLYNSGWFTVNDLKDWVKDKGKIIKNKR